MKIAVIGVGMMGSTIAWDLSRSEDVDEVMAADVSEQRLASIKQRLGNRVITKKIDVLDAVQVERFLGGSDAAVSALPHGAVHPADVAAVNCGAKLVNIAFEEEQMTLDEEARLHGSVLIPGCGVAPGLSNILVAEGMRDMDEAEEGHVYVGGLPQRPEPPLSYRLVFSVKGLIREYLTAKVIREGKVQSVKPFEEIMRVNFPKPAGPLEAFYTDGLGSSIHTLTKLRELDERTLRFPGHAEKIKFLLDAGFFSDEAVQVDGKMISPVDASASVLQKTLSKGEPKDMTVMRVEVVGKKAERRTRVTFNLIDYYDYANGLTSMSRTTGFTAAIVARMLGRGEIRGSGVLPPEISLGRGAVRRLLAELGSKGVVVRRTRTRASIKL